MTRVKPQKVNQKKWRRGSAMVHPSTPPLIQEQEPVRETPLPIEETIKKTRKPKVKAENTLVVEVKKEIEQTQNTPQDDTPVDTQVV